MKTLVALLPRSHREWGEALVAEAAYSNKPVRWAIGGIRLVAWSWLDWMIGGNLMKTVVSTLSIANIALGMFLVGILERGTAVPVCLRVSGERPDSGPPAER